MVSIHIHQFAPEGTLVDEHAMVQFQKQWTAYQKLVDSDVLAHRAAGAVLRAALMDETEPFSFLDIACGDASLARRALEGTKVAHYHGIDLAEPAIELAARMLDGVPYEVDLDHADFVASLRDRPEPVDIAWCGLSLHHLVTADKLTLLREIHDTTSDFLMLYEPARHDGEDRDAFVRRFLAAQEPLWTTLTLEEIGQIEHHIRTCDLPETVSGWLDLGREAGFSSAKTVFADPTDGLVMFRYDV
ncbi:MAG: class I SAM-dependent methyltransferase [Bauldia sp.]|nr:class I SAM-dependent methyltransferase [Bauldia sp.]